MFPIELGMVPNSCNLTGYQCLHPYFCGSRCIRHTPSPCTSAWAAVWEGQECFWLLTCIQCSNLTRKLSLHTDGIDDSPNFVAPSALSYRSHLTGIASKQANKQKQFQKRSGFQGFTVNSYMVLQPHINMGKETEEGIHRKQQSQHCVREYSMEKILDCKWGQSFGGTRIFKNEVVVILHNSVNMHDSHGIVSIKQVGFMIFKLYLSGTAKE